MVNTVMSGAGEGQTTYVATGPSVAIREWSD